ncbi:MAG: beta-lactamase family protein [Gemmataceae bacterium]|nr:beta-lactamase family protein [Gemmataceae bacterium]
MAHHMNEPTPHPLKRWWPAALLLAAVAGLVWFLNRPAPPVPLEDTLRGDIRHAMERWGVPGCAVAVVAEGEAVLVEGFGVREIGKPERVDDRTLFCLSSNSKAFASAALALLVEEGKVAWDDPVRRHLPGFRLGGEPSDATFRDLLSHRTGLAPHDFLWHRSGFSPGEVVKRVGLLPLAAKPRTRFQYCSPMVTAAGLATERVAGQPWGAFVEERLLRPLGMADTRTTSPTGGNVATPHLTGVGPVEARPWPEADAAGSVHASARDLAPWMLFQMGGKKGVLPLERLKETHVPNIPLVMNEVERPLFPDTTRRGYAMGWVAYDHRGLSLLAHGGSIDGLRCHLVLAPKQGVGVAVLSNLGFTQMNSALAMILLERMLGLSPRDWHGLHAESARLAASKQERRAKGDAALLRGGTFRNAAYGTLRIAEGRLRWRGMEAELEPWKGDGWTLRGGRLDGLPVVFDAEGLRIEGRFGAAFRRVDR